MPSEDQEVGRFHQLRMGYDLVVVRRKASNRRQICVVRTDPQRDTEGYPVIVSLTPKEAEALKNLLEEADSMA